MLWCLDLSCQVLVQSQVHYFFLKFSLGRYKLLRSVYNYLMQFYVQF